MRVNPNNLRLENLADCEHVLVWDFDYGDVCDIVYIVFDLIQHLKIEKRCVLEACSIPNTIIVGTKCKVKDLRYSVSFTTVIQADSKRRREKEDGDILITIHSQKNVSYSPIYTSNILPISFYNTNYLD